MTHTPDTDTYSTPCIVTILFAEAKRRFPAEVRERLSWDDGAHGICNQFELDLLRAYAEVVREAHNMPDDHSIPDVDHPDSVGDTDLDFLRVVLADWRDATPGSGRVVHELAGYFGGVAYLRAALQRQLRLLADPDLLTYVDDPGRLANDAFRIPGLAPLTEVIKEARRQFGRDHPATAEYAATAHLAYAFGNLIFAAYGAEGVSADDRGRDAEPVREPEGVGEGYDMIRWPLALLQAGYELPAAAAAAELLGGPEAILQAYQRHLRNAA